MDGGSATLPRALHADLQLLVNQVEIWFNRITQQAIRRGTFSSVKQLISRIDQFVQSYNAKAQPFVWTATAESILAKIERLCARISGTEHQLEIGLTFLVSLDIGRGNSYTAAQDFEVRPREGCF